MKSSPTRYSAKDFYKKLQRNPKKRGRETPSSTEKTRRECMGILNGGIGWDACFFSSSLLWTLNTLRFQKEIEQLNKGKKEMVSLLCNCGMFPLHLQPPLQVAINLTLVLFLMPSAMYQIIISFHFTFKKVNNQWILVLFWNWFIQPILQLLKGIHIFTSHVTVTAFSIQSMI